MHLEAIVEALTALTDRYGITITEVPERLREKILTMTGREHADNLEMLLQPLLQNFLRPIRIRAGHKVEERVIADAVTRTAALEGFSQEQARKIIQVWVKIFKVKPVKSLIENQMADEFDELDKQLEIKDDIRLITDASVEKVFNPFDQASKVVEPQVADFDGKFGDGSNEKVADFKISDAENQVSLNVESFDLSFDDVEKEAPASHKGLSGRDSGKTKRGRPTVTSAGETSSSQMATGQSGSKYTIDDAFKQLRNNNFDMASKIMMELARSGNSKAQLHLGEFYLMGTGVEISEDKAKYWLRKAAAQGSFPAKKKLDDLENGDGSGGCFGCFFTLIIVGGALKLLTVLAGM